MTLNHVLKPLAAAALLALASASQAAITVYTTQASFMAAIGASATDTFDDLTPGAALPAGPLARNAGGISYEVSSGPASNIMFGAGTSQDAWLSTNNANDRLTFASFSPGVYAAGANVFGSDSSGDYLDKGIIFIRASNGVDTSTKFKLKAAETTFFGFVSDIPLTMLEVQMISGQANPAWPTVNNLILAAVPEPETYAMMLAGLAAIGFMARRRRPR